MITVPVVSDSPAITLSTIFDGQNVRIELRWLNVASGWFMDLIWPDARGDIVIGSRLTVSTPIVGKGRLLNGFRGDFVAVGNVNSREMWSDGDGTLYWITEEEVAQWP